MKCPYPHTRPELGTDCVDPEACQSGFPCEKVRALMPESDRANSETDAVVQQIRDWWLGQAEREVEATAPKAVEYGATDLIWIGRTLGLLLGRKDISDTEATELGIFFYQVGKMGRWLGAIAENRRVSDDTIFDIGIYTKMVQRARDVGGWPFHPGEER